MNNELQNLKEQVVTKIINKTIDRELQIARTEIFVSGLLFEKLKNKNLNLLLVCFISLISAQLLGRLGWGLVRFIMGLIDKTNVFTFSAFLSGAFIVAWPGILVQLIIIPILIISLNKAGYIK